MENLFLSGRGGKREGAGRPKGGDPEARKVKVSFSISPEGYKWLKRQSCGSKSMSVVIDELITKAMKKDRQ